MVEARDNKVYSIAPERREGPDTAEGLAAAIGDDWTDEPTARRIFVEIAARGDDLARRIW